MFEKKMKFYSLDRILERDSQYNMIIGERSNGKTYSVLKYALKKWKEDGSQLAIIRRYQEDFRGKRGANMFSALVQNGEVIKATDGKFDNIYYYSNRWFFCKYDDVGKRIMDNEPFAYGFPLGSMEHDKSTSYPNINIILFDEFLSRDSYLTDEFVLFINTISTIVRYRNNVKIFMLGNTINQYSPYFKEMGITHIETMKKGEIRDYTYGDSGLKVSVEFTDSPNKSKPSDIYFAFDNPKLSMITGGSWELDIYPHLPYKYKSTDILFTYFIKFEQHILQCEVLQVGNDIFTYIHRKSTPFKDENNDLIFSNSYDPRPNWRTNIKRPAYLVDKKVWWFFKNDKVFYQDNEVGNIVMNYLNWCK